MEQYILPVIAAVVALVIGLIIGKFVFGKASTKAVQEAENEANRINENANQQASKLVNDAQKDANRLMTDAEKESKKIIADATKEADQIKKDKLLEVKENYLTKKAEIEKIENERDRSLNEREKKLDIRQQSLKDKLKVAEEKTEEVEIIRKNLHAQLEVVEEKKSALEKQREEHIKKLEQVSMLSSNDAKQELMANLKDEARTQAMAHIKDVMDEAKANANKEAKKIILQTIQRTAAEQTIENTVSVFNLDSDDQKGQVIGREGRNIRALEASTGVEFIVDDTPEAVIISGYDPVRREIARLSLQRLMKDGRIHPARIEEVVAKTKKDLEEHIMEIGERTVIELGIHGMHRQLIRYVGRMRFRSSYGQNLLQHSKETARLCATMASELGLSPKLAKRAGLLHDIGKVPEDESDLSHALLGMKLCEKFGEKEAVCNAVGAHHDEIEMKYIISPIVQACDAISGARPGARREIMEMYLQRIKDLENLALGYDGVQKAYAIQAGRELRVIVESSKVPDNKADELAFDISQKIQDEMTYPGQIKVTVIREKRAISVAR